jgi:hypothetical protein
MGWVGGHVILGRGRGDRQGRYRIRLRNDFVRSCCGFANICFGGRS